MVALLLLHTVIRKQRFNFDDAGGLTLGMLYIGMGFNAFTVARAVNFQTLLYGMLIVWLTDSGAYLFGRQFGKHKLAPNVSPNKTWEGSVLGTVAATVILAVYLTFFPVGYDNLAVMIVLTLSLIHIEMCIRDRWKRAPRPRRFPARSAGSRGRQLAYE